MRRAKAYSSKGSVV